MNAKAKRKKVEVVRRDEDVMTMHQLLLEKVEFLNEHLANADVGFTAEMIEAYQDDNLELDGVTMGKRMEIYACIGFILGVASERGRTVRELLDEEGL